jgi:CRP-like cAMP-binding protein
MRLAVTADVQDPAFGFQSIPFLDTGAQTETTLLTAQQRKELARIGRQLQLPARAMIYRRDSAADSVFVVADGVVKSFRKLPSGKRIMCAFLFRHDLFGLAERGRYLNSTQAITKVTLYQLPLGDLIPLIKRDAELQFRFLVKVTQELRESQRRTIVMSRRDAVGRLAMFLMMMRTEHLAIVGSDHEIPLPMSRTDIADFLGLSREAISRAFKTLQRRGIVDIEGRHTARIVDRALLARLATAV